MNAHAKTKIVVIGGGATGTGIARDAAERGFEVTLVERGDLGKGTTGNFHGILHSGARYAVNDPEVAGDCYRENQRLREMVPSAVTDTGGMFVALNAAEVAHSKVWMKACREAGIPVTEITPEQALEMEPKLSREVKAAFLVPDGFIDGEELIRLNREAATQANVPAQLLTNHDVTGLKVVDGRIAAVTIKDVFTKHIEHIPCDYVINASGVWAGRVAALADVKLEMVFDKGTMIVFKEQFSTRVLNRCRPEDDGDLLVPHAGQSIMGTTARVIADPDECYPTQEEVDVLLAEGVTMVPSMRTTEAARVYAGVRPLFSDVHFVIKPGETRAISRSFRVIDHAEDGLDNFISTIGGKVTLFRHMAEATIAALEEKIASN